MVPFRPDQCIIWKNCTIYNATDVAGSGAAIYASTGITVRDTVFRSNNASQRGTVYLAGTTSDSVLEDVTFDLNEAAGAAGAILFLGRKLSIDGMVATGNESTGNNGGAFFASGGTRQAQRGYSRSLLP